MTGHEVPWTDTSRGVPVAAALPEAKRGDAGWPIGGLPGLVRQVWLTVHITDLQPGEHEGKVVVRAEGIEAAVYVCSGTSPYYLPVELIELADHPFWVGTQAHPEFKSRPDRPHPLFRELVAAALARRAVGHEPAAAQILPAPSAESVA